MTCDQLELLTDILDHDFHHAILRDFERRVPKMAGAQTESSIESDLNICRRFATLT